MNLQEINARTTEESDRIFKERMEAEHKAYLERAARNARTTVEKIEEFAKRTTRCACHPWKHGMIKITVDEWPIVMEYINYFSGAYADPPSGKEDLITGHGIKAEKADDGEWYVEYIYVCEGGSYGHKGRVRDWCGESLLEEVL